MKRAAYFLPVLLLLCIIGVTAQEPGHDAGDCPADQAAARGMDVLKKLHEFMAPAWHAAYPDKDYAALGEAMNQFATMIPDVKKISHPFKTIERKDGFDAARTKFVGLVEKGVAANKAGDSITVYSVMPDVHTNFEEMAYYLLPLQFQEFEAVNSVVILMADTYLEDDNYDAIVTSLETLKTKNAEFQNVPLPGDLTSVKEKASADIEAIGEACTKLETADKEQIGQCVDNLKELCKKFEQDYI